MINIEWSGGLNKLNSNLTIGLDRDGVINKDLGEYITSPDQFVPIEGSLEAIAKLKQYNFKIAIITNQGGIEKGVMSQNDVDRVHEYMFKLLGKAGCPNIDALYYSASSKKSNSFAKPNTGMFKRCEKENPHIRFKGGYFVGDKLSDLKAAIKIGAMPVLVRTGYGSETEKQLNKFTYKNIKKCTKIFDTLSDFVNYVCLN